MTTTRTDAIQHITDLLGGTDRETAVRMTDTLHAEHSRYEDVIAAVDAMDEATFLALASEAYTPAITIRYQHTSPASAATISDAKRLVRDAAVRVRETADAADAVVFVRCDDGLYAYLDQASADADDTGVAAFAVIGTVED